MVLVHLCAYSDVHSTSKRRAHCTIGKTKRSEERGEGRREYDARTFFGDDDARTHARQIDFRLDVKSKIGDPFPPAILLVELPSGHRVLECRDS